MLPVFLLAFSNRIATAINIKANKEYRLAKFVFGKEAYVCWYSFGSTSPRPVGSMCALHVALSLRVMGLNN
jgi:hypothetical protein